MLLLKEVIRKLLTVPNKEAVVILHTIHGTFALNSVLVYKNEVWLSAQTDKSQAILDTGTDDEKEAEDGKTET